MINLNSVKKVYIIGDGYRSSRGITAAQQILTASKANAKEKTVSVIPTNKYTVGENDNNSQLMEKLRPLVGEIEGQYKRAIDREFNESNVDGVPVEHKIDPKILFLIDTSDKTSAVLARLFQGPWGGFPFAAKYTLAVDLSADNK